MFLWQAAVNPQTIAIGICQTPSGPGGSSGRQPFYVPVESWGGVGYHVDIRGILFNLQCTTDFFKNWSNGVMEDWRIGELEEWKLDV